MHTCEIIHLVIGRGENGDDYPTLFRKKESEDPPRQNKGSVLSENHTRSCRPSGVNEEAEESRQKYADGLKSSDDKREKSQEDNKNSTNEVGVSEN